MNKNASLTPIIVGALGGVAVFTALPILISLLTPGGISAGWGLILSTLVFAVASSLLAIVFLRKALLSPLSKVAEVVEKASSGQGNLAQNLELSNNSVLGLIGRNYNAFLGKLREMLDIIRRQAVR
ncbi:MAG: hypothetical protein ACM3SV_00205, partial [Betaproteobacteria bacterium]